MTQLLAYWKQALAVAALGAAFWAGWAWQGARSDAAMSDLIAQHAKALTEATEAARTEERRRFESVAQEGAKGDDELQDIAKRDDGNDADDQRLRDELAAVRRQLTIARSAVATERASAASYIGPLTESLERYQQFGHSCARQLEDARARGLTCERAWDALTGAERADAPGQ